MGASGGFPDASLWGELLSTACMGAGAVVDGYARDRNVIRSLGLPVLCRGADPRDINGRGKVVAHKVTVAPGNLVVGDDGVVIVPEALIDDGATAVAKKTRREGQFRRAVRDGVPPSKAFKRVGLL